mgnify:CR=1 FL=1
MDTKPLIDRLRRCLRELRAANGANVTVVKAALQLMGLDCGPTRAPSAWPMAPQALAVLQLLLQLTADVWMHGRCCLLHILQQPPLLWRNSCCCCRGAHGNVGAT